MYDYIQGEVTELTPAYAVVEAGGVGYYLVISLQTYAELEHLSSARVYTHFAVREDAQTLYGFATREEREVFRLLVSVSGVGGNTARMILSTYSPAELANILATENAVLLKNVKGLGLKTAQKIIVELKDKATGLGSTGTGSPAQTTAAGTDETRTEATAALTMLGFGKAASEKAVQSILKETPSAGVEEVIRLALKKL
ncbi:MULTISPECIES: Holliday junction branch migration protein RuvA [Rikenellaceae]|uniref:Holliday junction branch migration complex subunit RuvA n=1 Tax=Alistipes inops TaxID=1501391 RepID=A0ABR4YK39_9BACT|nr:MULTISPECIES: Holliday junction branch migration protein RuvA [Rikenellaceae]KHE42620.1 ATP-dependent DNA helicase RuvA [Alistipes inops]